MNAFDYFFSDTKSLNKDFVINSTKVVSFQDLYTNSLKIACYLNEIFGTGNNIVLSSENSIFFIEAYLAIIKSGNICVPIDPMLEDGNLSFIYDECNIKCTFSV